MINDLDIVQWDYLLSPEFEMINSAGKPLTGGYIEVYIHGTRNKYYCASDFTGTLHPFQIPLDSIGSNVILASPENAYDVYVYNKFGSLIMSRYNVHCQGGNGGSSTYVGDKLFYGQYRASNVTTIANLSRNKGNINLSSNGYLQLKNGMSYHITVRGAFQVDDVTNTETTLNYIEYTSVNPIKIDIDETKEGPQYFELSYDIYRLPDDMDYQVAFAQSNGMVTELLVEVHSLSNLATSSTGGGQEYEPGWGIDITNNVISVDPSILEDYVTKEELLEIVTGVTGLIPEDVATHTEVYEATVTAIEYVTGMIPDVSDYTTHTDVYESIVTAIDFVTGAMPAGQIQSDWDESDESSPAYIQNKPDLNIYATHDEVNTVSGQIIETVNNVSSVLHEEITNNNDTVIETINNVSGILHEEIIETAQVITGLIPDVSDFTTHEDVYESSVTAIQFVTGLIPTDYTTHEDVNDAIVTAIEYVTGIIPDAQVQSDWDQSDDTQPDYIKNKPDLDIYATHDEVVDAVTSIDLSEYATHTEVYDSSVTAIQLVTGLIPDVSDFTTHTEVYEATVTAIDYVTGAMPETINLVAGQNIGIFEDNNTLIIAASGTDLSDYTTNGDVNDAIVTAIEFVTGAMPGGQVQSDWTEDDTSDPAYIKNKPNEYGLVAGDNIGIIIDNIDREIVISASATDLSGCATHTEVHDAAVTAIEYVTGIIPDAQVQSNWTESDNTDPSYIQNKPNEYNVVAGQNIGISINGDDFVISASGTDLSDYTTFEDVISIVSGVTGLTEYGQFYATNISGAATMSRTKGTIDVTNDGKIKLKKGSSYHVTVRGRYNQTTAANTYGDVSYIEYITGQSIHVNVDKTITEAQYFELSYDLYKLNNDSNYYVFFSMSGGTVNDLFIEIHSLDGIGGTGTGPVTGGTEYDAGWGIQILNNVISVNPAIIPDISNLATKSELQDGLELVTGLIPTDYTTHDEVYEATVTAINVATGLIPDISNLATKDELQDDIELVTGLIPDISNLATKSELQDGLELVTGLIPPAQIQSDWDQSDNTQADYIKNKPYLSVYATHDEVVSAVSSIDLSEYATHTEVYEVTVTAIETATAAIPDVSDFTTHEDVHESIVSALEYVTGIIPDAQVQSDWAQSDNTQVDYIKNKPTEYTVVAGQNIGITIDGDDFVISASATDLSGYATTEQLQDSVELVTGLIPSTEGLATVNEVQVVSGYLQNEIDNIPSGIIYAGASGIVVDNDTITLDDPLEILPGANISFIEGENSITIAADVPVVTGYATKEELQDSLELVTGLIPDTSDLATKEELQNDIELVTGLIPEQVSGASGIIVEDNIVTLDEPLEILAGQNITFTEGENSITISADIPPVTGFATVAEVQNATVTAINLVTGMIPDVSDFATEEQLQDGLELVTGMIPEQEEIEFLELTAGNNISIVSGVISATGIPTIQLNSSNQVTAIDNYTIAGGGGSGDSDVFIATYGTTTFGEIYQAYLDNKVIYCKGTYGYNEDTGILHYYQGYYGNSTFEGVIINGTYETNVRITASSSPSSTSDSSTNWSGTNTTLALSSQIPATLSAGDGIAITNNTINVDNSVITTGVSGFKLPISNFKLDSNGQTYKAESAIPPFVSTGTYGSTYRDTHFTSDQFIDLTIPYHLNVSDCRYIVVQYSMNDYIITTSDDPITDIYLDVSKFNSSFGIFISWSTSKTADWNNVSSLSDTAVTLTSYPATVTIHNRNQGSGYSMIDKSNLERRAYDITPSEGYTWEWQLQDAYDILESGRTSNGVVDLSNTSISNWNNAVQLYIRKISGSTSTSPVLSYSRGGIAYVPYIYAEAPSNTGTYVLKCINGVIQWVAET